MTRNCVDVRRTEKDEVAIVNCPHCLLYQFRPVREQESVCVGAVILMMRRSRVRLGSIEYSCSVCAIAHLWEQVDPCLNSDDGSVEPVDRLDGSQRRGDFRA